MTKPFSPAEKKGRNGYDRCPFEAMIVQRSAVKLSAGGRVKDDSRIIELRRQIRQRLEKVRGTLTDEEFTRLVEKIARTTREFEKKNMTWGTRFRKDR